MGKYWRLLEIAAWVSVAFNAGMGRHDFAAGCIALACYCYLRYRLPDTQQALQGGGA